MARTEISKGVVLLGCLETRPGSFSWVQIDPADVEHMLHPLWRGSGSQTLLVIATSKFHAKLSLIFGPAKPGLPIFPTFRAVVGCNLRFENEL